MIVVVLKASRKLEENSNAGRSRKETTVVELTLTSSKFTGNMMRFNCQFRNKGLNEGFPTKYKEGIV